MTRLRTDERGVSEVLSTVLSISIMVLVFGGAAIVGADHIGSQTEQVAIEHLDEQGQRLGYTVATVDQLVRTSSSPGEIGKTVHLAPTVAEDGYIITVQSTPIENKYEVILEIDDGTRVPTSFTSAVPVVTPVTVSGGKLYIVRPDNGDSDCVSAPAHPESTCKILITED